MSDILRLIGAATFLAFAAFALREFGWRGAPVFALLGGVVLLRLGITLLPDVSASFAPFLGATGVSAAAASAMKIAGVGTVAGLSADVCRELGESGVAKIVQTVGRVGIFVLIFPTVSEIADAAAALLSAL